MSRRTLRRRYGRSGAPDPAGGWAQVQRMMKVYVESEGLGEYDFNSALPTGRAGEWAIYVRPKGGGKWRRVLVQDAAVRAVYARKGAS